MLNKLKKWNAKYDLELWAVLAFMAACMWIACNHILATWKPWW